MSWKRYFTPAEQGTGTGNNYSPNKWTWVRTGSQGQIIHPILLMYMLRSPNPIERYGQYNVMDNDSEVNVH